MLLFQLVGRVLFVFGSVLRFLGFIAFGAAIAALGLHFLLFSVLPSQGEASPVFVPLWLQGGIGGILLLWVGTWLRREFRPGRS